jgi:hypothetical protein
MLMKILKSLSLWDSRSLSGGEGVELNIEDRLSIENQWPTKRSRA